MVKKLKPDHQSENGRGELLSETGRPYLQSVPTYIRSTHDIGTTIKAARTTNKINQQTLADLANVGRRFVSELENGKPTLEFDKVISVANAMGIDLIVKKR